MNEASGQEEREVLSREPVAAALGRMSAARRGELLRGLRALVGAADGMRNELVERKRRGGKR